MPQSVDAKIERLLSAIGRGAGASDAPGRYAAPMGSAIRVTRVSR